MDRGVETVPLRYQQGGDFFSFQCCRERARKQILSLTKPRRPQLTLRDSLEQCGRAFGHKTCTFLELGGDAGVGDAV